MDDDYGGTNKYLLIQKLYSELDEEKEASATAASEALNMIFRLQKETAKQKMEDCQYKRMVEEKARYSEELITIFEDLLHQKQMEIDSLKYQIQKHVNNLSSLICYDNTSQADFSENQFPSSQTSTDELETRMDYLPVVESTEGLCSKLENIDDCGVQSYENLSVDLEVDASESCRCFSVEVKEVNEKIDVEGDDDLSTMDASNAKPITTKSRECFYLNGEDGCVVFSENLSVSDNLYVSTIEEAGVKRTTQDFSTEHGLGSSHLHSVPCLKASTSMQTQDTFEVPEVCSDLNGLPKVLTSLKSDVGDQRKIISVDSSLDYSGKDEHTKKGIICSFHGTKLQTPVKGTIPADTLPFWYHRNDPPPNLVDAQQFEHRLEKLEDRMKVHYEVLHTEEDTKLLREIQEKMKALESYLILREHKSKKNDSQVTSSLFSLFEEAVLSFSI